MNVQQLFDMPASSGPLPPISF